MATAHEKVRDGYNLFALRHMLSEYWRTLRWPDQAVSDPKFYALKDAIVIAEGKMN